MEYLEHGTPVHLAGVGNGIIRGKTKGKTARYDVLAGGHLYEAHWANVKTLDPALSTNTLSRS